LLHDGLRSFESSWTSRCGSFTGSDRSISALMSEKIAVFAPMPSARDRIRDCGNDGGPAKCAERVANISHVNYLLGSRVTHVGHGPIDGIEAGLVGSGQLLKYNRPDQSMDLNLKGKVALLAGASKGLGYAVAHAMAREGASVSIASRRRKGDRRRRVAHRARDGIAGPVDGARRFGRRDAIQSVGGRLRGSVSAA
jgi:hypothetical protein